MKHALRALVVGVALSATFHLATAAEPADNVTVNASGVLVQYADIVHASYDDTLQSAKDMQKAIDAFLAHPSAESQQGAKKAWLAARESYGQTEAYRFYGGPIDSETGPEERINAWPMDESYVDYVQGRTDSGLIRNPRFVINRDNLIAQNVRGGEENIATGWHAIEFLLWGQDLSETGPGERRYTDFVDGKRPNADRRRQYLKVITDLLVDDLTTVSKEWKAGRKSNYRAQFEKGGVESLRKIFVGLGSLSRGELAGERMEVALASQDQEDEHSCFSDNSHRDIVNNALGIENVWLARYKRPDGSVMEGPSLRDLVAKQDSAGGLRIVRALDVPTRAHGLLRETDDTLLAVARRPGDWLLRWDRNGRAITWRWIEPRRAFSGHAVSSADGRTVYTTEADLDTGAGLIGVRDATTLDKRAEWSTHGIDAHELIRDITDEGRLIVANGGVPTRPETGRAKRDLARMDSSLVRLDARSGEPAGQWRLTDRRLSLRHLAWGAGEAGPVLGIALQAEHDDPDTRASAPALAVFDGRSLRTVVAPVTLAGYGGDVAASGRTFAVSCPRAQGVALYNVNGNWRRLIALEDACALVSARGRIWAGGRHAVITWKTSDATSVHTVPAIRLDNHWIEI